MVRLKIIVRALLISMVIFISNAASFDFSALELIDGDQSLGQVLYKDTVVMQIYATGPFVTAYSRAQMIAYRLNEYLESYSDINKIKLSYPENIYTASIAGRNLFSVYKEDAKQKNTRLEPLMSEWINNIKLAMTPKAGQVVETQNKLVQVAPKKLIEAKVEVKKLQPEVPLIVTEEKVVVAPVVVTSESEEVKDIFNDDTEKRLVKLESALVGKTNKAKGFPWIWVVTFINLALGIYLFFMYRKTNKQVGNYEEVEKTGRMEEIENSVSVLIQELKEVSGDVADSAIKTIKEQQQPEVMKEIVTPEPELSTTETLQSDEPMEVENKQTTEEIADDISDLLPDINDINIVPDVEEKEEIKIKTEALKSNGGQDDIEAMMAEFIQQEPVVIADTLEEVLESESPEIIQAEDKIELEKVVENKKDNEKTEDVKAKTDAEKLAEELSGPTTAEEQAVINSPNQTNLSGVGMAELFKILSQLDKDIRDEVKLVLNNKALNKNEKIIKMKQLEMDPDLIAKVLGIGKEEVSLVIQLNDLEKKE
jgi:hypothetical protein